LTANDPIPNPSGDERTFRTPWEARVFSIAVTLSRHGLFSWDEFREHLIAEINGPDASPDYYQNWLHALEEMLTDKGTLIADEIEAELAALEADQPHPQKHSHPPDQPLRTHPGSQEDADGDADTGD
jgi:nitrile hydratase accessory protein